jgi:glycosyltransferase involved in cell wall biosynthesis
MRLAITTDWLTSFGGAERVLSALREEFHAPPIFTSVYDPRGVPPALRSWDVRPSVLQHLPGVRHYSRALLPFMPWAFDRFDFSDYDAVISCSSAFSKNVTTRGATRNICYCFTPPRYLWDLRDEYTRGRLMERPLRAALTRLREADRRAATRVHQFVADSNTVAERIQRSYGRSSVVVYPPVDTSAIQPNGREPEDFYLVVARLVRYKRVDLAIEAANAMRRPLWIVGVGPELPRLRAIAGPTVRFLGSVPDAEVAELYARCRAFLFPGLDDFGIAPVEAQAAGRPVVAYGAGGALETVIDGTTGVHFHTQTTDALVKALERLDGMRIDPAACRRNADRFNTAAFGAAMRRVVTQVVSAATVGATGAATAG